VSKGGQKLTLRDPRQVIRRLNLAGIVTLGVLIGVVGGWAAVARISGAVIASGTIVVESKVKKVQHPTGGVVRDILVREGSEVRAGDVVMRLDDTQTRAMLGTIRAQLDELMIRETRLVAERDGDDALTFPEALVARRGEAAVAVAIAGEEKLFESRRKARVGQRSQLRERITQIHEEIGGLAAQQEAKTGEIRYIAEELSGVTQLYQKNLISISRLMHLQRDQARLQGERGQLIAEIARARGKISETELQILQIDQDFRSELLKDLRETQGRIADLKERRIAAEDQLQKIDIRAPQSGTVNQLTVHTVGGVVANGETIMQIVPGADRLVMEAKVAPQDVDQVAPGATAIVRILAGNQRTMPDLEGVLELVSADLTRDPPAQAQPAQAYYLVRIALDDAEVRRLGDFRLVPGMPAEAFIRTSMRTPLEYLLKPLSEQIARTFRER
jgi:HlyD family secretion protein